MHSVDPFLNTSFLAKVTNSLSTCLSTGASRDEEQDVSTGMVARVTADVGGDRAASQNPRRQPARSEQTPHETRVHQSPVRDVEHGTRGACQAGQRRRQIRGKNRCV